MPINNTPTRHNQVVCANIFVRKDGKYLVIKRSLEKKYAPGYTHAIGGSVDPDENPYLAAQREVHEEAGIEVTNMRLEAVILEVRPVPGEPENWLIFHFSADYLSGEIAECEEGEFVLLTLEELKQQQLYPSVVRTFDSIFDPNHGTTFATIYYDEQGKVIEDRGSVDICKA